MNVENTNTRNYTAVPEKNPVLEVLARVSDGLELMRVNMDICDTETCRSTHTIITIFYAKYHSKINQTACSIINL
jgi:hypothetical protein